MSEEKTLSADDKMRVRRLLTDYCEAQKKIDDAVAIQSSCHDALLDLLPDGLLVFTPYGSFDVDYYTVDRDGDSFTISKVEKL